jgi:hypothetical protein
MKSARLACLALVVFVPGALAQSAPPSTEVVIKPGVILRLGQNSSFRMVSDHPGDNRVEMLAGTAFVIVRENVGNGGVKVVCEDVVSLSKAGVYRFDAYPAWNSSANVCRLRVYKGTADVRLATVEDPIPTGGMINLSRACADMIPTLDFDVRDAEALDENNGYFRSGWIIDSRKPAVPPAR